MLVGWVGGRQAGVKLAGWLVGYMAGELVVCLV